MAGRRGPGLAELTCAIDRAGVGSDVRVLGYRQDIGQTLAQCDLLLITSWEESFCLAALEAMACGLCVIATSVGGLTEVAEHGRSALLFEPGDYDEAVRLAHRLLTERDLRLEIRRHAAERAHDFSARAVVESYEAVYQLGLCAAQGSGRTRCRWSLLSAAAVDVLAFSPHPDDVEFFCSGSMLLAARRPV